jgi:hypothetical protein
MVSPWNYQRKLPKKGDRKIDKLAFEKELKNTRNFLGVLRRECLKGD